MTSRLPWLFVLVTFLCTGCEELPPLTVVLGVDWVEATERVNGQDRFRTFRLEADSFTVTQHCNDVEVQGTVPAAHRYIIYITEGVSVDTMANEMNCRASYRRSSFELGLDSDGRNVRTLSSTPEVELQPYTDVNGLFGGRSYTDEEDVVVEWFFTPTTIETVARCPNDLIASATVPVEIEHYFRVEETDVLSRSQGSCDLSIEAGLYRYFPEDGALSLTRNGEDRVDLTLASGS